MFRSVLVFSVLFCIPIFTSHAAVVINEVAWMGSADSANDEWIELYNTGATESVEGWVLSDGAGLEIILAGSVAAGQYAVLERTDDTSAPGTAFLIYTGSLANTGRTLTLKRTDGSIVDQVAGGENWEHIGGDNATKETAQYTTAGWITASPTPGSFNKMADTNSNSEPESQSSGSNNSFAGNSVPVSRERDNEYVSLSIPDTVLTLDIIGPTRAQVNQEFIISAQATGIGKTQLNSLNHTWNFGNTKTATGKEVKVSYEHPGTYVVVVEAAYTHHRARARQEIVVLPAQLSLGYTDTGDIIVHNDSKYELDISGYVLKGVTTVVFPELSFLAAGASLILDRAHIGTQQDQLVILYDQTNQVVASLTPTVLSAKKVSASMSPDIVHAVVNTPVAQKTTWAEVVPPQGLITATATSRALAEVPESDSVTNIAAVSSSVIPPEKLPYLGLIGLMMIGVFALYAKGIEQG